MATWLWILPLGEELHSFDVQPLSGCDLLTVSQLHCLLHSAGQALIQTGGARRSYQLKACTDYMAHNCGVNIWCMIILSSGLLDLIMSLSLFSLLLQWMKAKLGKLVLVSQQSSVGQKFNNLIAPMCPRHSVSNDDSKFYIFSNHYYRFNML